MTLNEAIQTAKNTIFSSDYASAHDCSWIDSNDVRHKKIITGVLQNVNRSRFVESNQNVEVSANMFYTLENIEGLKIGLQLSIDGVIYCVQAITNARGLYVYTLYNGD